MFLFKLNVGNQCAQRACDAESSHNAEDIMKMNGPAFVYDPACSDSELAQLIVKRYPTGVYLADNPLETSLLWSGDLTGPERYMRIFKEAEMHAHDRADMERIAAFRLEFLKGICRQEGAQDLIIPFHLAQELRERIIPAVACQEHRLRLRQLYGDHLGGMMHLAGEFELAADLYDSAAHCARVLHDDASVIICEARSAYERACGAVAYHGRCDSQSSPREECIEADMADFLAKSFMLNSLDNSNETSRRWKYGNGPVSRLVLSCLARMENYQGRGEDEELVASLECQRLGRAFNGWIRVAAQMTAPHPEETLQMYTKFLGGICGVEERAVSLIIMARAFQSQARIKTLEHSRLQSRNMVARCSYLQVVKLTVHGVHMHKAIAERELRELERAMSIFDLRSAEAAQNLKT